MQNLFRNLTEGELDKRGYHLHFVTAREMVNIVLAACDGRGKEPGQYRDYRFQPIRSGVRQSRAFATKPGAVSQPLCDNGIEGAKAG